MSVTLALSGVVNVVAGLAFLLVGLRFVPRRVSPESQLARQAFAVYWAAMGAYTLLAGLLDLLAAAGVTPFPLFLAARLASLPILVMSVGGITFYFLFLFTGDQRWVWPVTAFFSTILVGMTYYIADRQPVGVLVSGWRTDLAYANAYNTPALDLIVLGVALPPILCAIAFVVLAVRLPSGAEARRARNVGFAILVWSLAAVIARIGEGSDLVQMLSRPVLGLGVAITVVRAYAPVAVRRPAPHERDDLLERVHQLI